MMGFLTWLDQSDLHFHSHSKAPARNELLEKGMRRRTFMALLIWRGEKKSAWVWDLSVELFTRRDQEPWIVYITVSYHCTLLQHTDIMTRLRVCPFPAKVICLSQLLFFRIFFAVVIRSNGRYFNSAGDFHYTRVYGYADTCSRTFYECVTSWFICWAGVGGTVQGMLG